MQQQVRTFGIKEFTKPGSNVDLKLEELRLLGYTTLHDVISSDDLSTARVSLDRIYQTQLNEIGGWDNLKAIGDPYTAMCPLAYDEFFIRMAADQNVLEIVSAMLGDYFILMLQNGILNVPEVGDTQTSGHWHRDIGYQHFVSSRPIGLTAIYCIDDFNERTGGTRVLPSSHRSEAFPTEEYLIAHEIGLEAPAGSVVIIDSMLYHRGGHNTSPNVRRGINCVYTLPLVRQQISLPTALGGRYREDPFLAKLLGYESEVDGTVQAFRQRRLARKKGASA